VAPVPLPPPAEYRLARAVLQALPDESAVLSPDGQIVAVNEPWRRFGRENGAGARCAVGTN
jgi:hypothetical protein